MTGETPPAAKGVAEDIQFELNSALEFGDYPRAERMQRIMDHVRFSPLPDAVTEALRELIDGVQKWCDAVGRGTSWDYWDHHYKRYAYNGGLDKARDVLSQIEGAERKAGSGKPSAQPLTSELIPPSTLAALSLPTRDGDAAMAANWTAADWNDGKCASLPAPEPTEGIAELVERLNGCSEAMDAAAKMAGVKQRHYRSDTIREAAASLTALQAERDTQDAAIKLLSHSNDSHLEELGRVIMACPQGMRTSPASDGVKQLRAALDGLQAELAAMKEGAATVVHGNVGELLIEWPGRLAISISKDDTGYAIERGGKFFPGNYSIFDEPELAGKEIAGVIAASPAEGDRR